MPKHRQFARYQLPYKWLDSVADLFFKLDGALSWLEP